MAHWVMIEMSKLSKEKRARVETLLAKGICCRCEKGKEHSRWECHSCLAELYNMQKYGDPMKAAEFENKLIRQGKLAPLYDKTFSHLTVKKPKRVVKAG